MNNQSPAAATPAFDPAAHGWFRADVTAFGQLTGPIWQHEDGERLRFGFLVEPKHLNRGGNLHGGMLMTLADQAMAITSRQATGVKRHATIDLNIQFVGTVRLGEFVEAHAEVVRATRSVVFVQAKLFVGQRVVATTSGIWKILEQ